MSQLFPTPEDPWSLPTAKHTWAVEPAPDPLQDNESHEDDDSEQQHQHLMSSQPSSTRVHTPPMEGSIWGEEDPILSPTSAAAAIAAADKANDAEHHLIEPNAAAAAMSDFHAWSEAIRHTYSATSADVISVKEIPEREGILFKHTNYLVEHHVALQGENETNGERKVIRRYSDFVWLLEVLLKRYTFRLVPELPPKKLGTTSDALFMERRRRGLARFLNALVRHPVLRSEQLVIMFLTVPTDLSGWRRQAQYDSSEEFVDRKSSSQFVSLWSSAQSEFEEMLIGAEGELKNALDNWNRACVLVERLCVRQRQIATDMKRLSAAFASFKESTNALYPVEESRVPQINEGLRETSKHIDSCIRTVEEDATHGDESVLEEFKRHLDYLHALRALFERYSRLGGNTIVHLSKRKDQNEQKLAELQGKPDVKGAEVERLTDSIASDRKEIARQTNRDWLIKECILTEFIVFQETQFQITRALRHWSRDRLGFTEKHTDNWSGLSSVLQDMPMSRSD